MPASLSPVVRAFLKEPRFAVLATINRDRTPQQSVVWCDLDEDVILMNTRRGRVKDRNLRRDPRCSICVDDGYRYVTIRGSVRLIDDQNMAQADIKRLATRYHDGARALCPSVHYREVDGRPADVRFSIWSVRYSR